MRRQIILAASLGIVLLLIPGLSWAQMATLTGVIQDKSGGVVPGATVGLSEPATGGRRSLTTGADGTYTFPALRPSTYTLRVEAPGFGTVTVTDIQLQVDQIGRRDVSLEPAAVRQQVTVTGGAPVLQTEEASVGQVVGSREVVNLPLNGRNFKQLALILPGTVPATDQSVDGTAFNIPRSQFVSNGAHALTYSYRIDGVENVNSFFDNNTLDMSVDAIREFKIEQNNFSVDAGRGTITTSLVTKSGTNALHGGIYEFLRNDKLDARNFFDRAESGGKGSFRQNQFGADVGGPIVKDKLFFFGNFEGRRSLKGYTQYANFPTPDQLSGDLSGMGPILDPELLGTASCPTGSEPGCFFANNQIPQARFSQYATAGNQYWPIPNAPGILPGINDIGVLKQENNFTQETFRLDWRLSDRDTIFARETTDSSRYNRPDLGEYRFLNTTYHTTNLAFRWGHTLSPRTMNDFLFGYNFGNYRLEAATAPKSALDAFGMTNLQVQPQLMGIPFTSISGFGAQGPSGWEPWYEPDRIFQWTDSLTMVRGTHTIKIGGELVRFRNYSTEPFANRGYTGFTGIVTGNPIADYLLGYIGYSFGGQGDPSRDMLRYLPSLYIGDDWKARSDLTLNLGFRWDASTQPTETHNRLAIFDPDLAGNPPDPYKAYRQAGVNGVGSTVNKQELKTFAPRLGFAYRPLGQNRFVLRGGFGMFYGLIMESQDEQFYAVNLPFFYLNSLFSQGPTSFYRTTDMWPAPPPLWPDSNAKFVAEGQGLYTIPYTLKFPTAYEWNSAVQTLISPTLSLDIAYVGDVSHHGVGRWDVNQAVLPNAAEVASGNFSPIASRRPFPTLSSIISSPNWGNGNYNALQIKAEKRYSNGVSFLGSYTWGKAIDDYGIAQYEGGLYYYNRRLDRSRSGSDARHMFTFSYTWELPFGSGKRYLSGVSGISRQVVDGWSINGITSFRTGLPLTIFDTFDRTETGATSARPDRVCNGNLPSGQRTPIHWFETSCFAAPQPGTLGTAGRRIIDGPGTNDFDFSLFKNFKVTEGTTLEFRSEFFNIFNHPNLNVPGTTLGTGTFGVITAAYDPREIQFGLKLLF